MARWLCAVAAVAVLAGCTTGNESDPTRVLGDLATVDPCGFTDLDVFAEFGAVEFGPPETLGYCTVVITPGAAETVSLKRNAAAEKVTIMIGELVRPSVDRFLPTEKLADVTDSIYTSRPDDIELSCWQAVVFAEADLAISVRSRLGPLAEPTPTCDMVAAGVAEVAAVLEAGEVEHRSPAPNSLIGLDPCELVADDAVTALPGLADARRVDSPGRHHCLWRTSPGVDGLHLRVTFGVAEPPELPQYVDDGNTDPIAGRPSVTHRSGKYCEVETGHIPFEEVAGVTGMVETVVVETKLPDRRADPTPCAEALTIASALWPRLPDA